MRAFLPDHLKGNGTGTFLQTGSVIAAKNNTLAALSFVAEKAKKTWTLIVEHPNLLFFGNAALLWRSNSTSFYTGAVIGTSLTIANKIGKSPISAALVTDDKKKTVASVALIACNFFISTRAAAFCAGALAMGHVIHRLTTKPAAPKQADVAQTEPAANKQLPAQQNALSQALLAQAAQELARQPTGQGGQQKQEAPKRRFWGLF